MKAQTKISVLENDGRGFVPFSYCRYSNFKRDIMPRKTKKMRNELVAEVEMLRLRIAELESEVVERRGIVKDRDITERPLYESEATARALLVEMLRLRIAALESDDVERQGIAADRERAETSLHESEATARALLEAANDSIYLINRKGTILMANKITAIVYDMPPDEIIGANAFSLLSPEQANIQRGHSISVFETGRPVCFGNQRNELSFDTCFYPVFDDHGKVFQIAIVARDITEKKQAVRERKRLEYRIQEAQKLESLGVLAGGIAHDFNNLLMAILGNADLTLRELPPTSPNRQNMEEIIKASNRAAELCKQMLAYSGQGHFIIEHIDLTKTIEDMDHLLQSSISDGVSLKMSLECELPLIEADVSQIQQILTNLITNASEAIGEKSGFVVISTGVMDCDRKILGMSRLPKSQKEGKYVFLKVEDTGCGMEKETIEKLFDPFFTTKFTGRGLGLSAVLGIVRGHNGAIMVESELGHGTTFMVLFPAANLSDQDTCSESYLEEDWKGEGLILVVDDEKTVLTVTKKMLESMGFTVLTAENGREGVEIFRKHKDEIDCVILDFTMPYMNGDEVFDIICGLREDVKILIASGYSQEDVIGRFSGKQPSGYLKKPYRSNVLASKLKELLEKEKPNSKNWQ